MKRRLNKKGKILFTTLTILISAIIYVLTGKLGQLASTNIFYQLATILAWIWLVLGQFTVLYFINED